MRANQIVQMQKRLKECARPLLLHSHKPKDRPTFLLVSWEEEAISITAVHRPNRFSWLQTVSFSWEENFSGAGFFVLSRQAEEKPCLAILSHETMGEIGAFGFACSICHL